MPGLAGLTVAILQARRAPEFAALIERHGGVPLLASCMREVAAADQQGLQEALEQVAATPIDLAVFQTGVGAAAMMGAAAEWGRGEAILDRLRRAVVVVRGPKPLAVLQKHGIRVDRRTAEPHTTAEILGLLEDSLEGFTVLVQQYGAPNTRLVSALRLRRARVIEVSSYAWDLPADVSPVLHFLRQLEAGAVGLTSFTSASQVDNLFRIADTHDPAGQLAGCLERRTVVAAIGPVCAQALTNRGLTVRIQPDRPKMVPFVNALCAHVAGRADRR